MYICSKEITTFKMIGIFRLLLVGSTISITHLKSSLAIYVKSFKVYPPKDSVVFSEKTNLRVF